MRINNNIMAMNTHRQYSINNDNMSKATEKLSSGYRINSAADDAAGLAISEKMRAQIRGLDMASKNSEDAISLVQTAEGALEETESILQRMRELAVQSSSDTNENVDRTALEAEYQQLMEEIGDIADDTSFNNMKLLDGSFGSVTSVDPGCDALTNTTDVSITLSDEAVAGTYAVEDDGTDISITYSGTKYTLEGVTSAAGSAIEFEDLGITITFGLGYDASSGNINGNDIAIQTSGTGAQIQSGANEGQNLSISIAEMSASGLAIDSSSVADRGVAESAITTLDSAINTVSGERAKLGALQNRLEHKINNLDTSSENLSSAESRIRDIDMAEEMTQYTQTSILVQAATSMLAQANAAPQNVLTLLQ